MKYLFRFPNMSVGLITRQSIRRALSNEITADLVGTNIFLCPNVGMIDFR